MAKAGSTIIKRRWFRADSPMATTWAREGFSPPCSWPGCAISWCGFLDAKKPLLGICNGYQVLTEAGILPGRTPGERTMALLENQSARFEDRKVRLIVSTQACTWTEGLVGQVLNMPSAHGEGRPLLCASDSSTSTRAVFYYGDEHGRPTMDYPSNPNGSPGAVAGITDETGLVLGLMPHPERASLPTQYSQDGLRIFQNLVKWLDQ